ncbi:MAG TPA: aminotransferase class I/II-fold pyridoxal phosphate-dependent enzyme [Sporichthyaceae bacterium]|jgi:arginine/lysine/ornithine decarboxylase
MDHSRAPVLEALLEFRRRGDIVYGPPGHRQGRGVDPEALAVLGESLFAADVLMLNGLDDRTESDGVLLEAEKLLADAVHAERTFFATCGSSMSVKTAMISVAGPGEKLLLARNTHKSVLAGLIISGIEPVWIPARHDEQYQVTHPPGPAEIGPLLAAHPDAKGVLVVSPTDWGSCADLPAIAQLCHDRGVPFVVDEAWGAHLPFHDRLPCWGMDAGADVVVTSVHKMGAAIEQSSTYHLQGNLVDPELLARRADVFGTTSSSALVYASIDAWRRQMVRDGKRLWGDALARADRVRAAIETLGGLQLLDDRAVGPTGAADLDPMRITIDLHELGITGYTASDWLRAQRHLDVGSSDSRHLGIQLGAADDDESEQALIAGLRDLHRVARTLPAAPDVPLPGAALFGAEQAMTPQRAFFAPAEHIPTEQALKRVCAEMLSPYPPGVPVLLPGEVITAPALDYLVAGAAAGMHIPDAADPTMRTIRVVGHA